MFLGAHTKQQRAGVRCLMRIQPSRTLAEASGRSPRQHQLADASRGLMSVQIRLRHWRHVHSFFLTFGTRSGTTNMAGRQVMLSEREGNTSHTVPAPYQTVAAVFAGIVQAPQLTREAIGQFHWSELKIA